MEISQAALEQCLTEARDAGVPRDQAETFLSHGYIPLPWQWEFHAAARLADLPDGPVDIGAGGARGPGKSHAVLSQVGIDDCQRIPGLKGLFLRQTGVAAKESFDDLVDKVLRGRVSYARAGNLLRFPNSSRIVLGGFKDAGDIDKYIGIEYDFIIVEELNQLTEEKYTKLRGSLRTSKPGWRPRMYTSFNPGGIGHAFVKNRYVIPYRENRQAETRFVGSTYRSNPYLNKEYIDYLEGLAGDLGKAWREGEWEIFAGQFFGEFRRALHVCRTFKPKSTLTKFGGIDWGRTAPFAFLASALDVVQMEDGRKFHRMWTYREVYGTEKTPKEWAQIIMRTVNLDEFAWIRGDPAMFTKGQDMSISIADQFKAEGVRIKPASNDRVGGWTVMHDWLSLAPDGLPYWIITESCPNLIRTLPELIHDENKVEDVDTEGEDHAPDAGRYLLKHVKWIDARVGGVKASVPTKPGLRLPLKTLDLDKFASTRRHGRTYRPV